MKSPSTFTKNRSGAKTMAEIPSVILDNLQQGLIPTANLVEALAVNQALLAINVLNQLGISAGPELIQQLNLAQEKGFIQRCRTISTALHQHIGNKLTHSLENHPSDMVRFWAILWPQSTTSTIESEMARIQPFANDPHFSVREIAWLALRPFIVQQPILSIQLLIPWTHSEKENLRRFASESTRPRGVWCAHIPELKANPELGIPLLENLMADPSIYVQNSVANWLNDAGKTRPDFLIGFRQRWIHQDNKSTQYILKRGLRNLKID
jgi:3-methyladenine DNA glycosylase AlkC